MSEQVHVEFREDRKRHPRPRSASYIAVRNALFQLTSLSDFATEKIGAGFYADVFKVHHKVTGEVMVLKMNKSRKNSKQMLAEIQLMNRLSHPNILRFRGSCVHEGQLHALTEYINSGSLEDLLLNRNIELSWSVRVKMARDIARGMAYLHSRGIFHRDLTSKNCLIQREADGKLRTVVADFGLAAKIKQARRRSYTEVVGSPYWMAPECLNGKQYDEQADFFSYGIILAEIMARIPADPDFMPRTRFFGVDFEALKKLCVGCPDELWQLMRRCCQIDPDERPTFTEVLQILDQIDTEEDDPVVKEPDLISCYSEPTLRMRDSDSSASEGDFRSLEHQLDSFESVESISSSDSLENDVSKRPEPQVFNGMTEGPISEEDSPAREIQCSSKGSLNGSLSDLCSKECSGSRHTLVAEEEHSSHVKSKGGGDSGIDPGDMFKCPLNSDEEAYNGDSRSETLVAGNQSNDPIDEVGALTPLCASPALYSTRTHGSNTPTMCTSTTTPQDENFRTPSSTSNLALDDDSNREIAFLTQCTSPTAQSIASSSDFSFRLPTPSTPWAPPSSPVSYLKDTHSLPTSPTCTRRQFRHSLEMPSDFSVRQHLPVSLNRRSTTPSLGAYFHGNLQYHPTSDLMYYQHESISEHESERTLPVLNWDSLCTNLDEEHFTRMTPDHPLQRSRSRSNPGFSPRKTSANYSLTLSQHSPDSDSSSRRTSGHSYKCYKIRLNRNYRLSSSAPNLLLLSAPIS